MNCSDNIQNRYNAIISVSRTVLRRIRSLINSVSALIYARLEALDSTGQLRNLKIARQKIFRKSHLITLFSR
jgi:hypothetical protein